MTLTCEHCGSNYPHPHHPGCIEGENARLRALLDERTALLRECEDYVDFASTEPCACTDGAVCLAHVMKPGADLNAKAMETLSRIRAALETKCDS